MKKVSLINRVRWMLVALIGACSLMGMVSCSSNDEPEMYIDYYLSVQSRVPIFARGGLPLTGRPGAIGRITREMQIRIREVYPEKNMVGNDTQVLIVCDQAYRQYASWGYSGETMCIVKLYKVLRCGTLIKERRCMNAYNM